MPFGWVAADEICGQNGPLQDWLEERHVSYVLAVPKSFPVATAPGLVRADHLAARVPAAGWQQVSCGDGSKGPRYYDWALITTTSPDRHLLVRRCLTPDSHGQARAGVLHLHAPACTAPAELVRWPAPGGRSRNASRPPRTRPAWTTTRSAATTPGTGTPHCPCSRLPSSRSAQLKRGTNGCGQLSRHACGMVTLAATT
jgi:hypothetical protein